MNPVPLTSTNVTAPLQELSPNTSEGLKTGPLPEKIQTPPPEPKRLDEPPSLEQNLNLISSNPPPAFTRISDMHLQESDVHYGLGMDHLEQEDHVKGKRYEALAEVLKKKDNGSLEHGRFNEYGLSALIIDEEAGLIGEEAPLTQLNDPRMAGRNHSVLLGGVTAEDRVPTVGQAFNEKIVGFFGLEKKMDFHPSDQLVRNCQALLVQTVMTEGTILFHLDEVGNLPEVLSGSIAPDNKLSVTTNELLFIKNNWEKPIPCSLAVDVENSNFKTNDINFRTGSGQFDDNSIKFFNKGIQVPSPFAKGI